MSYPTSNPTGGGYANQSTAQQGMNAPPQPTRFSNCAGQLDARVAHFTGLFDRIARVVDRLGGSVPEEATKTLDKIRGGGSCIAAQFESSLEELDAITRRAERTVERLETL